jgi:GntR family transcriptional regulator, transcriptional repressor for pyruvate dehydrogenase complex
VFGTLEHFRFEAAIERSSLPEQVFRRLVAAVLEGRYEPGERLPPQRTLAAELGVNMASLREGIKRLEQLRLVEVRHGDAMRVQDWRANGGLDVLAYAATADPALTGALFEARRLLLREAARLAATRRSADHERALAELAGAFAATPDDVTAQMIDLAFMQTLIDAAGNVVFQLIINSIRELYLEHLERFRPIVADRAGLAPLYARAARAVAAGSATRAATAVERLAAAQETRMLDQEPAPRGG